MGRKKSQFLRIVGVAGGMYFCNTKFKRKLIDLFINTVTQRDELGLAAKFSRKSQKQSSKALTTKQ